MFASVLATALRTKLLTWKKRSLPFQQFGPQGKRSSLIIRTYRLKNVIKTDSFTFASAFVIVSSMTTKFSSRHLFFLNSFFLTAENGNKTNKSNIKNRKRFFN